MSATALESPYALRPWLNHYDYWVRPHMNYPRRPLHEILRITAVEVPDRPATAFLGAHLTFSQIKEQSDKLATALSRLGIAKSDRVGIMLPNCPQYLVAAFAVLRLGATIVNINPLYTPREILVVAQDSGMRALLTLDALAPAVLALREQTKIENTIITSLAEYSRAATPPAAIAGTLRFADLLAEVDEPDLPRVEIDTEEDVAVLQYTGGTLNEGYGLSEASPVTHSTPSLARRKPGSIGLPIPDTDMKIVDLETGTREVTVGEEGELCIAGPQVMKGYWNRPDETAIALRPDAEGRTWLYTGDVARMDEDGYTYIVQRKKDMIIVSGFNVYPSEVEGVLYMHPAVIEAAVIGVPDAYRGEAVKACVVLKSGATATSEELKEHCEGGLAEFKVPREIEIRESLPKTAVGKILHRVLREEDQTQD